MITDGDSQHSSLEPCAEPLTSSQITQTRRSESPVEHTILDELQDLKDLYTYTFGTRPRGPRANIASWLHGQIQNAQFEIMDERRIGRLQCGKFSVE